MIRLSETRELPEADVLHLYRANKWSSADKPDALMKALAGSDLVVTAWDGDTLVGLGNAISDGHLVVYYPHLLVLPEYHGRGVGARIVDALKARYSGFHQHMLVADQGTTEFYRKCGFERAGKTEAMWIYTGGDH
jgi:GNAT superfamily N-acetyltransferase